MSAYNHVPKCKPFKPLPKPACCIATARIYIQWPYETTIRPWVGAKPRPDPRPYVQSYDFKNNANNYMLSHIVWAYWSTVFVRDLHLWGGPGVEPHGLQYILTYQPINQCRGATWKPTIGPRGTQSLTKKIPRHRTVCTALPHHPIWTVRTVQSASNFFTCLT
jgi:hypothetical protein